MIKEFANLRNIHINSLLYYEKLGLLKPAYINPQTKYRYYEAEQLPILDTIIMCVNLGIPLKEMKNYIDTDGHLNYQELLDYGKILAKKKMQEIQTNLYIIEHTLNSIVSMQEMKQIQKLYTRTIKERHIIISKFFDTPADIDTVESETAKLYKTAQQYQLVPLLPAGIIFHYITPTKSKYCIFMEIANQSIKHSQIIVIPKGEYPCVKVDIKQSQRLIDQIPKYWECTTNMTILLNNVYLDKYNFRSKPGELQKVPIVFPTCFF